MAHAPSGLLGPISGKVGDQIGYIVKGKQRWRSAPKKKEKISITDQHTLINALFLKAIMCPFSFYYTASLNKILPGDILQLQGENSFDYRVFSTSQFEDWTIEHRNTIFCTDGPDGFLDPKVTWHDKDTVRLSWNLSQKYLVQMPTLFICGPELQEGIIYAGTEVDDDGYLYHLPSGLLPDKAHLYFCDFESPITLTRQQYFGTLEPFDTLLKP